MSEPEQRQWGYSFEGATNLGPCVEEEAGTPEEGVECAEGGGIPIESGEAATSSNGNQETLPNSPDILNGLLNWFWQNFPGQPVTLTEENGRYVLLLQQPPLEATILESPKELPTGQIPVPIPSTLTQNIVAGADQLVAKELGTGSGPSCPSDNQGALTPQTNAHYEHQVPFQSTLIEQLLVKRKVNARTLLTDGFAHRSQPSHNSKCTSGSQSTPTLLDLLKPKKALQLTQVEPLQALTTLTDGLAHSSKPSQTNECPYGSQSTPTPLGLLNTKTALQLTQVEPLQALTTLTGQIPVPIPSTLTQNIVAGADQLVAKESGTGCGPLCSPDDGGAPTPPPNADDASQNELPYLSAGILKNKLKAGKKSKAKRKPVDDSLPAAAEKSKQKKNSIEFYKKRIQAPIDKLTALNPKYPNDCAGNIIDFIKIVLESLPRNENFFFCKGACEDETFPCLKKTPLDLKKITLHDKSDSISNYQTYKMFGQMDSKHTPLVSAFGSACAKVIGEEMVYMMVPTCRGNSPCVIKPIGKGSEFEEVCSKPFDLHGLLSAYKERKKKNVETACTEASGQYSRRLLDKLFQVVGSDAFPRVGAFNHRTEYAADGKKLLCCDYFERLKVTQQAVSPAVQPRSETLSYKSSARGLGRLDGNFSDLALAGLGIMMALLFLKNFLCSSGAKKATCKYSQKQHLRRNHSLAVPGDLETNSTDIKFRRYPKN
eukprot:GHVT01019089.1.p1 GENE.GHVT01019089.1~~GHVT01019089.1.p1  ORF type:complete len:714 (+),score=70.11 GHVT01019089.1:118-2259(+)